MSKTIVVVKFGSELVTDDNGVDQKSIDGYAAGLVKVYKPSSLIVVTSGAVKTGRARASQLGVAQAEISEVTLSQIGAAQIVSAWEQAFAKVQTLAGGLLVTHNELQDSNEGPQFVTALSLALESDVVSIVNENDALSDTELMQLAVGGDNDGLAAHIAQKVFASKLVLFTAKGGIVDDQNQLVAEVNKHNAQSVLTMLQARESNREQRSGAGRGGIITKYNAAYTAAMSGIEATIAQPAPDMIGDRITKFMIG